MTASRKIEDIERGLIALTEEILSVSGVAPTDDFLELGGASLTAARLTLRIEKAFGVDMPQALIFDTRSLRELAQAIAGLEPADDLQPDVLPIGSLGR